MGERKTTVLACKVSDWVPITVELDSGAVVLTQNSPNFANVVCFHPDQADEVITAIREHAAAPDPRDAALAAKDEEIGRLRGACESAVRGLDVICDHFALHGNSWDVLRIKNLRDKVSAALRSREAPDVG